MTIEIYPPAEYIFTTLTWVKTLSAPTTTLSGLDDSGQSLAYTQGQELVYLNGVSLTRGVDYTATTGTSITFIGATSNLDVVKLIANSPYNAASIPSTSITGSIANSQLANSTITLNGVPISLGGSTTVGSINSIVAGNGLTGGGSTGTVTLSVNPSYLIPAQAGNAGKQLTTDGINLSWSSANVLPTQSAGTVGQYLQSNGTTTSWQTVPLNTMTMGKAIAMAIVFGG